jgi:hypothetical protein
MTLIAMEIPGLIVTRDETERNNGRRDITTRETFRKTSSKTSGVVALVGIEKSLPGGIVLNGPPQMHTFGIGLTRVLKEDGLLVVKAYKVHKMTGHGNHLLVGKTLALRLINKTVLTRIHRLVGNGHIRLFFNETMFSELIPITAILY